MSFLTKLFFSTGLTKDTHFLTITEPYVTQAHDVTLGIMNKDPDLVDSDIMTLEVSKF